nr:PhzF family phenazine biosynthesis protein [Paracoccus marcusii]
MFAPGSGVPEDPATGSATATLAAPCWPQASCPRGKRACPCARGSRWGARRSWACASPSGAARWRRSACRAVPFPWPRAASAFRRIHDQGLLDRPCDDRRPRRL